MSNLLISLLKLKEFAEYINLFDEKLNLINDSFTLITVEPPFRLITMRNLFRMIYLMIGDKNCIGKLRIKDISQFNESYVHIIYKLMEYLENEIFSGFMLEVFEEEINCFE